jgi:K(+)-stimulated pyrophosphate-energized sodium pump
MQDISSRVFYATIVGLVVGAVISSVTEYYTGLGTKPVMAIVQKSSTGAGTNVIAGLATGMISHFLPFYCLLLQFGLLRRRILWSSVSRFSYDGDDRNAISDRCFGPISDAGGIAEMSELPKEVTRTDILIPVGNTTAATEKVLLSLQQLTSLALFAAYVTFTGIDGINIFKAPVLAMLFVGGMIPVVFLH